MPSPFVDLFRGGRVPVEVREAAAQGGLTSDPIDQLELLVVLLDDPDARVCRQAEATLDGIPRPTLEALLARPEVAPELRAAFAARGIEPGSAAAADDAPPPVASDGPDPEAPATDESRPQMLTSLPVIDKIKLALKGTREQRTVLVRDPNKVVAVAVLTSPKLNTTEVEAIARMSSVQEEVLRIIGSSQQWIRHYPIVSALVGNPKTPLAVAMPLVSRLQERDLKIIVRDRNVPDGVRMAARRFLLAGESRRH